MEQQQEKPDSVRVKRMQMILKKALDTSVKAASTVDLRLFFEEECKEYPELLDQFFGKNVAGDDQDASLLAAQTLRNLRHKIQTVFEELCEQHDVNAKLSMFDELIKEAEEVKLQNLATSKLQEEQAKENEAALTQPAEGAASEATEENGSVSPASIVRAHRLRVMEESKQELEKLVQELEARNAQLQANLDVKCVAATDEAQKLRGIAEQLHEVGDSAKDYAACP